jgi:DNA repair exonuclease SbcCD ATPase subunit
MRTLILRLSFALCGAAAGCSSVYYAGMESIGFPKRDILRTRVERARDAQQDVKEQFSSALERFRATVRVEAGELERRYDTLNAELDRSAARAEALETRIDELEDVAEALFDEWEDELDQYKRSDLRRSSAQRLRETRRRYTPMMAAMRRAHARVERVLDAFRDVVLALKHQLNAHAVSALQGELDGVEREVEALVSAMNASMQEAERFLQSLEADPATAREDDRAEARPGLGWTHRSVGAHTGLQVHSNGFHVPSSAPSSTGSRNVFVAWVTSSSVGHLSWSSPAIAL